MIGFASNWFSKAANTVIQLIQVPVFFHFWPTAVYGDWVIISAIPTYLTFSSIGFGNVASNEMTMLVADGDREGALRVFQSCWWLIALICGVIGLLLVPVLYFLPAATLLHITTISSTDTKWIILYLGVSVLLGQLEQLMGAAYTCVARYAYGSFLKNLLSLGAFMATMVPVVLGHGPRTAAEVLAGANILGTIIFGLFMRRDMPWVKFGWSHARFSEVRRLAPPAFAFMGFPVGIALNLQGTLLAINYALGPDAVAVFSTARTVSRVALQMVQMVNNTVWPELSLAYGARNIELLRTLHRRACQTALLLALGVTACMMSFGPWFLTHWTGGKVPPSRSLLAILLLGVIVYSLWSTSATLATAVNKHQRLAAWYIVSTGVTVVFTFLIARRYGLYGAAWSLILSELIMNLYVVPASLRIAEDTLPAFLASMLHYPGSLKPAVLMARLGRSKPRLEAE
ncbi:MAG TPA: polysaccharide biosynthesis C-terminal domain-containing protein [Acidobacteriaceae bacterium]|nr:polysaccharide biosynthesis C-terminal domain-containing protein [Acidobacteriaceae bacterium]